MGKQLISFTIDAIVMNIGNNRDCIAYVKRDHASKSVYYRLSDEKEVGWKALSLSGYYIPGDGLEELDTNAMLQHIQSDIDQRSFEIGVSRMSVA
jgi:hypothetical protein